MSGALPEAAAASVSVIVLGSDQMPPSATADDVQVVSMFDDSTTVTVTLLGGDGEPVADPVPLDGLRLFEPHHPVDALLEQGLIPCSFGDSYSQVGVLTADEAAFYNLYSPEGVGWSAHIGELVEFTAEIIGVAYVRVTKKWAS